MSTHQPLVRNVRIVTCDGYCEEVETAPPKRIFPEATSNRDAKIRHDLESELQWDPRIDDRKIGVVVHHGIVTLTGEISSYSGRRAVEEIPDAHRRCAAKAIANEFFDEIYPYGACGATWTLPRQQAICRAGTCSRDGRASNRS